MIYKSVFIFLKKLSFWKYNDIIEWEIVLIKGDHKQMQLESWKQLFRMSWRMFLWKSRLESVLKSRLAYPPNQFMFVYSWLKPVLSEAPSMKLPDVRARLELAGLAMITLQKSIQRESLLMSSINAVLG